MAVCLKQRPGAESCFAAQKALPRQAWRLDWDDKGNESGTTQD